VAGPWITEREIRYVTDAVSNAWYTDANVYHGRFESAFADYIGRRHAIALPSCTSALHLSLLALGVGPHDEVAIADSTWIASAAPIQYVGATPIFVDVDPVTWCMDADSLAAALTPRTKAVITVDLYGGMPDMAALEAVAASHGVPIVEDAAEAIGSEYRGRRAGGFGVTGVFSFHGSKTLTTGEGGMLVTDDDAVHARCLFLRDHGRNPGDTTFRSREVAYKYKMSSMQAALGLAQLERIDELIERKREIFSWYRRGLNAAGLLSDGLVQLNGEPEGVINSYWMVTAILAASLGLAKEEVMSSLRERGVDTRPFFDPLSSLPAYAGLPETERARRANPTAYELGRLGVNLPSGFNLEERDVAFVCEQLADVVRGR